MRVLLTGGAGFIGSNFVRHLLLEETGFEVIVFDKLTYAGNLKNIEGLEKNEKFRFLRGDITDRPAVEKAMKNVEAVVHMAAESHVDRSIMDPTDFVKTNVLGTLVLLMAARDAGIKRFVHVSTDEVYGSLGPEGSFTENSPLAPNSPYSASKASSDLLVRSWWVTHGFPAIITRSSNNYGPYQFPEKVIPLFIANALEDKQLPLYGDGMQVRDWIYVKDHCRALVKIIKDGKPGEVYNIGGGNEIPNIELARIILEILCKPESLIKQVKDRPGHDRRYALDTTKINAILGWKPELPFREGIEQTVNWYLNNRRWLDEVRRGEYQKYYEKWYSGR